MAHIHVRHPSGSFTVKNGCPAVFSFAGGPKAGHDRFGDAGDTGAFAAMLQRRKSPRIRGAL